MSMQTKLNTVIAVTAGALALAVGGMWIADANAAAESLDQFPVIRDAAVEQCITTFVLVTVQDTSDADALAQAHAAAVENCLVP